MRSAIIAGDAHRRRTPAASLISPTAPGRTPVVLLQLPAAGSFRVATDRPASASISFVDGWRRGRVAAEFTTAPGGGIGVGVSASGRHRAHPAACHHHAVRPGYRRRSEALTTTVADCRPWVNVTSCSTTTRP